MSKPQTEHAARVVARFKEMLSADGKQVGKPHLDELELLIESAIDSAVLEEAEHFADRLEQMAQEMRKRAERFEG
jgi:hypothetical protein